MKIFTGNKYENLEHNVEIMQNDVLTLDRHVDKLQTDFKELKNRKDISEDTLSRIADLEVKMAKLWALLVETTPMGKEKLSKFGRRFGGKSKQDIR
jgi:peptidoglycan hydrolase CwlO-like protein